MTDQVDPREEAPEVEGPAPETAIVATEPREEPAPAIVAEPASAGPTISPAKVKKPVGRPRKVAQTEVPATVTPAAATATPEQVKPAKAIAAKPAAATKVRASKPAKTAAPGAPKLPVAAKTPAKAPATSPAAAPLPVKATAPRKEHSIMTATTAEFTDKFQSAIKDATDKAKAAFEKSQASLGDVTTFAKGNVEAIVESSKILATGLQEMGKGYVTESKSAVETLTAEIKDLTSVKSPTEFFEKQTALLRKQFDAAVAASSKNSEAFLKLANEAFQPISNRVSLAVEKIKQAA